eukprot:689876-Amphidinium_carterae.1
MSRTLLLALAARVGHEIPSRHPLVFFVVSHAAQSINCHRVSNDGRTAEELRIGRPYRKTTAPYGELVMGHVVRRERKQDLAPKAVPGLHLGSSSRTGFAWVPTKEGVEQMRGITRLAEKERWGYDPAEYVIGCPWGAKEKDDPGGH